MATISVTLLTLLLFTVGVFAQNDFYEGCGSTKGCVGTPDNCVSEEICTFALSYFAIEQDVYQLEMIGTVNSEEQYLAIGFSADSNLMNRDNVVACNPNEGVYALEGYWIQTKDPQPKVFKLDDENGNANLESTNVDNVLRCKFTRESSVTFENPNNPENIVNIDLNSNSYQIIFASGNRTETGKIGYHSTSRGSNGRPVYLAEYNDYNLGPQIYLGCDETKGCFGNSETCISEKNCDRIASYRAINKDQYMIEIQGLNTDYVAFSLSMDEYMGEDSIMACTIDDVDMYVALQSKNVSILDDNKYGISEINTKYQDGITYCSFVRDALLDIEDPSSLITHTFDMNEDEYFLFLAQGELSEQQQITYHRELKNRSEQSYNLTDFNNFLNPDYEGCAEEKGCFGIPLGCEETYDCRIFVFHTVNMDSFDTTFTLLGNNVAETDYLAVGLSFDDKMGDDSVTLCYIDDNNVPQVAMAWNTGANGNKDCTILDNAHFGISNIEATYNDGVLRCSFTRQKDTVIPEPGTEKTTAFNLETDSYFRLLATGPMASRSRKAELSIHVTKAPTGASQKLSDYGAPKEKSYLLHRLHGSFMVVAWFLCGACGIFTARYGKKQFGGKKIFGKDLWFPIHQVLMSTCWLLAVAALIMAIVEFDFGPLKPKAIEKNPHGLLGILSFCFMFIQPFMAQLRCDPQDAKRPIFNWAHFLVGAVAMILAMVTIYFATIDSFAVKLKDGAEYVAIAYMAFFGVWHLVMTGYDKLVKKDSDGRDWILTAGLVTYFPGALVLTAVMVVMVAGLDPRWGLWKIVLPW